MSPIIRSTARLVPTLTARRFTTATPLRKTVTETAKDTLKAADRTVSDQLVKGINAGANAAEQAKGAINSSSGEASGKAEELKGQASGTASSVAGQAKGKASELAGQAKGKAEEVKGKMS